jgi:glycosyltransferase involved in cell wall biosynthesis
MLEEVFRQADRFDITHFHVDYLHYPFSRRQPHPHVTTLHGRLDIPELVPLYREYAGMPVISISDAQRRPLTGANWQGTVYHGLPEDLFGFHECRGEHLAFLGRVSRDKRLDRAIKIARRTGRKLKIAAKIDKADRDYFKAEIEPSLGDPLIEYLGEVGGKAKEELVGNAHALLFPIDWPEPFGLVMIEAMACGTPVIAWRCGSVPEIMLDGVTGFIVDNLEQAVHAVEAVAQLDRAGCRRVFEKRYTAPRMAEDYLAIYRKIINQRWSGSDGRRGAGTRGSRAKKSYVGAGRDGTGTPLDFSRRVPLPVSLRAHQTDGP